MTDLEKFIIKMRTYPDISEYDVGKTHCIKTYGNSEWYLLQCMLLELEVKNKGYHNMIAVGEGFTFEFIEGDCILSYPIINEA